MMETQICKKCLRVKPLDIENFYYYKNNKNYSKICRECQNQKLREWRKTHPLSEDRVRRKRGYDVEYIKRHRESIRLKQRNFLWNLKEKPCADCKRTFHPLVMQFDHLDPKNKFKGVSNLKRNKRQMLDEIAKCELVCANCHAIRTFKRKHGMRIDQKIRARDWGEDF